MHADLRRGDAATVVLVRRVRYLLRQAHECFIPRRARFANLESIGSGDTTILSMGTISLQQLVSLVFRKICHFRRNRPGVHHHRQNSTRKDARADGACARRGRTIPPEAGRRRASRSEPYGCASGCARRARRKVLLHGDDPVEQKIALLRGQPLRPGGWFFISAMASSASPISSSSARYATTFSGSASLGWVDEVKTEGGAGMRARRRRGSCPSSRRDRRRASAASTPPTSRAPPRANACAPRRRRARARETGAARAH